MKLFCKDIKVYQRVQVILLSRLDFSLAAPTPSFLLAHMVEVGIELLDASKLISTSQETSPVSSSVPFQGQEPSPVLFLVLYKSQEPFSCLFYGLFLKVKMMPNDSILRVYIFVFPCFPKFVVNFA